MVNFDGKAAGAENIRQLWNLLASLVKKLTGDVDLTKGDLQTQVTDLKKSVSDGKTSVANAITGKGVTTATDATFATLAANVAKINTLSGGTADATAAAAEILTGKTAYVKGAKVTGTMANQGAKTASLNCGGSYTIPKGYHSGSGKVTANSLASQTSATAEAAEILSGETAYVNGAKVTGTMANQGAKTASLNCGGSYTIPAGYHNGNGKVSANSLASQTVGDATADDLIEGKIAWVNGKKIIGTKLPIVLVTVHGAALETVTLSGGQKVYTDADGLGSAIVQIGVSYTLTGSVSGYTSAAQIVTERTSDLYAMPKGALYWYGNECTDVTGGWTNSGYSVDSAYSLKGPVKNTNYMYFGGNSSTHDITGAGTVNIVDTNGYSMAYCKTKNISTNANYGAFMALNSKNFWTEGRVSFSYLNDDGASLDISNEKYYGVWADGDSRKFNLEAVWLE